MEEEDEDICDSSFLEKYRNDAASSVADSQIELDVDDDTGERYVFDPQFGVIPASCSDAWKQQLKDMETRRMDAIAESEKKRTNIPPVRFTSVGVN